MGDELQSHLRSHLNNCFLQCDIIIAASRVYNNVDSFLRKEAKNNNFRLIKAINYRINDNRTVQDECSQESAKYIVDLIDKIMRGII